MRGQHGARQGMSARIADIWKNITHTQRVASLKSIGRGSLVALTTNADDWSSSRIRAGPVSLIECHPIGEDASSEHPGRSAAC
jgi:hypothetical protein